MSSNFNAYQTGSPSTERESKNESNDSSCNWLAAESPQFCSSSSHPAVSKRQKPRSCKAVASRQPCRPLSSKRKSSTLQSQFWPILVTSPTSSSPCGAMCSFSPGKADSGAVCDWSLVSRATRAASTAILALLPCRVEASDYGVAPLAVSDILCKTKTIFGWF